MTPPIVMSLRRGEIPYPLRRGVRSSRSAGAIEPAQADAEPLPASAICQPQAEARLRPGSLLSGTTGGQTERFSTDLLRRVAGTLWDVNLDPVEQAKRRGAAFDGMAGFAPRDPVEGLLAALAMGHHMAATHCLGLAMHPEQPGEAASRLRHDAVRSTRAFAEMAEAIDRRRGKGQQTVRVEHVTVNAGGQAIVGQVAPSRGAREGG